MSSSDRLIKEYIKLVTKQFELDEEALFKLWQEHKETIKQLTKSSDPKRSKKSSVKSEEKVEEKGEETTTEKSEEKGEKSGGEDDYSKLSLAELKELCKTRGLKVSGGKKVLVERLLEKKTTSEELKEGEEKKKTTSKSRSKKKIPVILQKIVHNADTLNIRRNVFGNYEHIDTGFIFDEATQEVIGKQSENLDPHSSPIIEPLTEEDIEKCKEYNFAYRTPETISSDATTVVASSE